MRTYVFSGKEKAFTNPQTGEKEMSIKERKQNEKYKF